MTNTRFFTTKRMVTLSILSALGTILMFLEIPLTPAGEIKLDTSDLTVLIAAFITGPVGGVIVAFIKALLHFLIPAPRYGLYTGVGVEQLIAFTASLVYMLPIYFSMRIFKKFFKSIYLVKLMALVIGTITLTVIMPLLNYLLFVEMYYIYANVKEYSQESITVFAIGSIVPNIIKGSILSFVFYLISLRIEQVAKALDIYEAEKHDVNFSLIQE